MVGGGDSDGLGWKLGSARRNGAADVAWPTRINIANKPAGMGMEQKETRHTANLEPCPSVEGPMTAESAESSLRKMGDPLLVLQSTSPLRANEPRGGVVRNGRPTNGVNELYPSGGLARACHQTLQRAPR